MSNLTLCGFYILKDEFFSTINDPNLKNNKKENRPFYYCVKECNNLTDIYWMIPMSSRVDKYKNIIATKTAKNKSCDGLYICKLPTGSESVFLIQDILPVTAEYVARAYTLGTNHLILPYQDDVAAIDRRAKKVIQLVKKGIKLTPTSPDIVSILSKLNFE